jgi:hypothetical protein
VGGALQFSRGRRDLLDDPGHRLLEGPSEVHRGLLAHGGGFGVRPPSALGLRGGVAGDHGPDRLDRPPDHPDLVAALRLDDRGLDVALRHTPQDGDEALQRPRHAENDDHRGKAQGGEQARQGGADQDRTRLLGFLPGRAPRLAEAGRRLRLVILGRLVELRPDLTARDDADLDRRRPVVPEGEVVGAVEQVEIVPGDRPDLALHRRDLLAPRALGQRLNAVGHGLDVLVEAPAKEREVSFRSADDQIAIHECGIDEFFANFRE